MVVRSWKEQIERGRRGEQNDGLTGDEVKRVMRGERSGRE